MQELKDTGGVIRSVTTMAVEGDLVISPEFHYPPVPKLGDIHFSDGILTLDVDGSISKEELQVALSYAKKLLRDISEKKGVRFPQLTQCNTIPGRGPNEEIRKYSEMIYWKYDLPFEPGIFIEDGMHFPASYINKTQADHERIMQESKGAPSN